MTGQAARLISPSIGGQEKSGFLASAGEPIEVDGIGRTFSVKIASGYDDYEQAFLLLAEKYQARGYEEPGIKLFRFTPFHVLPDTITVVAREGGRVAATLSMVPDTSLLGLPLEAIYSEEIDGLRRRGRKLVEVTSLADDGLAIREFLPVFVTMIRLILQCHVRAGGDSWVIAVHPRHGSFYRRVMGLVPLGGRRSYPAVLDAPAEAYWGDPESMRRNAPQMFARIFGDPLPEAALTPPLRPADHVEFFGTHSTVADRPTIREIALAVERPGCPPRWRETGSYDTTGVNTPVRGL